MITLLKRKNAELFRVVFCSGWLLWMTWTAYGQTDDELTGIIIFRDQCDNEMNLEINAFDDDINTYFTSCQTFGTWIGLDLLNKHVITKVVYCPRIDQDYYGSRLLLGVFEGANQADFGDAIPLFIIKEDAELTLNEQEIACTRGFRYVRFVFPNIPYNSYLSELKFYGYPDEGDDSLLPQLTNLPTISIKTVENEAIVSKENFIKGIVSIVYNNGQRFFSDSIEIRGRGNSSWTFPKKPYRMRLQTSTQLMGLPARARNWTLINNYDDKTLMRNTLAYDFSRKMEMTYTSPCISVDVVLNGDYVGNYQLSDHVDVRRNRVDIEEMSAYDVTGGYFIEIDAYAQSSKKWFFSNTYQIPITIKYPDDEDITPDQEQYIIGHVNKLTNAVYNQTLSDFGSLMEIESYIRHFLINEFAGNTDTFWSIFMSKKRDDDKFYFGPVWDFNLGFENDSRTYPINEHAAATNEWVGFSLANHAAGQTKAFITKIMSYVEVQNKMKEIYAYYRSEGKITRQNMIAVVDSCATLLQQSQDLNFKRWPVMNQFIFYNPVIHGSFEAEVANVKTYIRERLNWMDQKLEYEDVSNERSLDDNMAPVVQTNRNMFHIHLTEPYKLAIYQISGTLTHKESLDQGDHRLPAEKGFYIVALTNSRSERYTFKCVVP